MKKSHNRQRLQLRQRIFAGLLSTMMVALCLYGYFLNETVSQIVERKEIEQVTAVLATEVSAMESKYLESKSLLTLDYAYQHGFVEVAPEYMTRSDRTLTLRSNR